MMVKKRVREIQTWMLLLSLIGVIIFFVMMIFIFSSNALLTSVPKSGVSCDFCMKSNFRGRRYKCLICYDYDLCAECYESNATSTRHTTEHAVQCILTRSMLEVAYGSGSSSRQFQSFTCPYCSKKGFSDTTLLEHVTAEHSGNYCVTVA
jgi:Zinc finger, ZZ type/Drought induced 19 protein (Di19), zinc-binding